MDEAQRRHILELVRGRCLALPETSERLSHGAPTFFVRGKRAFVMVLTNHHGDGRFALWCAAAEGMQQMLVEADPERFFVPSYVGHRGWLGFRLDRGLEEDELAGIVEDAYAEVARKHGLTLVQLALGWLRTRWYVGSTILGATSVKQLDEDIDACTATELDAAVLADVAEVQLHYPNPAGY